MYVITGATGNIGGVIARTLLAQGLPVRVIGRDAARLQPLVELGAQAAVGRLEDAAFVREAFAGAKAVFAMIPPAFTAEDVRAAQGVVGEAIAAAVAANKVPYVVHLSSFGADLSEGTGPVLGVHDQEARLDAIEGLRVLHLRPTYFMENLLGNIGLIQSAGINGGPLRTDLAIPLIATRDIAAVAAEELTALAFTGSSVRTLLGPRDYTSVEVTRVLGAAIGRPDLSYVQFPYEQVVQVLIGVGASPDAARGMVELNRAMNEGRGIVALARDERSTTPTTLETFAAQVFAPAFAAGGAAGGAAAH